MDIDRLSSIGGLAVYNSSENIEDSLVLDLSQRSVQTLVYAEEVVEMCGELVCHDSVIRGES